jgi:hypothetical protein
MKIGIHTLRLEVQKRQQTLHVVRKPNPKGIEFQSPGLRVCELPWEKVDPRAQPQRVCGRFRRTVTGATLFRVGARFEPSTQGSSRTRNPGL